MEKKEKVRTRKKRIYRRERRMDKNVKLAARLDACESALIDMVQQFFYSDDGGNTYAHAFMSAEEEAAGYLVKFGIANWENEHQNSIVFKEVSK